MATELETQIAAYLQMQDALQAEHDGKWIIVYNEKLEGVFETFEDAAEEAVGKFGRGPYLIRQVGVDEAPLPASLLYGLTYADG